VSVRTSHMPVIARPTERSNSPGVSSHAGLLALPARAFRRAHANQSPLSVARPRQGIPLSFLVRRRHRARDTNLSPPLALLLYLFLFQILIRECQKCRPVPRIDVSWSMVTPAKMEQQDSYTEKNNGFNKIFSPILSNKFLIRITKFFYYLYSISYGNKFI